MYTITAKSCDSRNITFTLTANHRTITECRDHLCQAFRHVEITCDETGEVMFTGYQSDMFFYPTLTIDSAVMLCLKDEEFFKGD